MASRPTTPTQTQTMSPRAPSSQPPSMPNIRIGTAIGRMVTSQLPGTALLHTNGPEEAPAWISPNIRSGRFSFSLCASRHVAAICNDACRSRQIFSVIPSKRCRKTAGRRGEVDPASRSGKDCLSHAVARDPVNGTKRWDGLTDVDTSELEIFPQQPNAGRQVAGHAGRSSARGVLWRQSSSLVGKEKLSCRHGRVTRRKIN